MRKKVILITGALGEIGQALIEALTKDITARLLTLDIRDADTSHPAVTHFKGDILDSGLLARIVSESRVRTGLVQVFNVGSTGAVGTIDRREFDHWGRLPDIDDADAFARWSQGARAFGRKLWDVLGERRNPAIVFEHSGEDTLPTSLFVCDNAGMVVICGGTSGYNADLDLRLLWMRQKRLQGSHYANRQQCAALNRLVAQGRIDPCLSEVFPFAAVGAAHQLMYENRHPPGNMAVLVNAPRPGLRELPA